ncbi:MAG: hypothetical protein ACYC1D_02225 [Acidimicrobiales bacterium]
MATHELSFSDAELHPPKSTALKAMFWRSEILQVMYWLRGEGFGDLVDAPLIERFLGVDAEVGITYMGRLVEEGYLDRDGDWFTLSKRGLEEGALEFASSFSELTRPTHGECSADCWCHASPDEADACLSQRAAGHDH